MNKVLCTETNPFPGVILEVTGKYEFAIMHPKDKEDARHILGLSIGLAGIMSVLLFGLSFLVNDWVGEYYENPTMGQYLWMVPIGLFCFVLKAYIGVFGKKYVLYYLWGLGTLLCTQ